MIPVRHLERQEEGAPAARTPLGNMLAEALDAVMSCCGARTRSKRHGKEEEDQLVHCPAHERGWWKEGTYRHFEVKVACEGEHVAFSVMLDSAAAGHAEKEMMAVLREDLVRVGASLVPLAALRTIAASMHLFVNVDSGTRGAETHWTAKTFDHPTMHPRPFAVEINSWLGYLQGALGRHNTLLHEFAHVFNATLGSSFEPIKQLYEAAERSQLYDDVAVTHGPRRRAYGMQNHLEFFASLSVAFLGGDNDYEPFTRGDLERLDPASMAALQRIWDTDNLGPDAAPAAPLLSVH